MRPTEQDYQALAEFRYQIRRFLRASEEAARAAGLEPQQHQLLLAVKGLPPDQQATIGQIAERLQIQHHSAVELVNRLEERGLVMRERSEADRRQVLVRLTARGEEILHDLAAFHRAEIRSIAPRLIDALTAIVRDVEPASETSERPQAVDPADSRDEQQRRG